MLKLAALNVRIIEKEIMEIKHTEGQIENIIFKDGQKMIFDVLYASVPFKQHTDIPYTLGCALTQAGYIEVDSLQKTTVQNIFACGDNSSPMRSIAYAVASGSIAGSMVNKELADEQFYI